MCLYKRYGSEDVLLVGTGIAGGFALGASVGVLTIDNHTTASIGNAGRVYARSVMWLCKPTMPERHRFDLGRRGCRQCWYRRRRWGHDR